MVWVYKQIIIIVVIIFIIFTDAISTLHVDIATERTQNKIVMYEYIYIAALILHINFVGS